MILDFSELPLRDIALSDISVIYQTPVWDQLGDKNSKFGRKLNGFLLIDRGQCRYEWDDCTAVLDPGALIYLGKGCKRTVSVTARPFSFYRISFRATDLASGEDVIFREQPWVVTKSAGKSLTALCEAMLTSTLSRAGALRSSALLFEFFDVLFRHFVPRTATRITPAVEYIDTHYTETTDLTALAKLCALSESQFFAAFRQQTGMPPIRYRNHLRVEQAKLLLAGEECTNREIAELLGFESLYYFSRVFKNHTGMSPSEYAKSL